MRAGTRPLGRPAFQPRYDRDILFDGHVGEEADVLEDVPDVAAQRDRIPFARIASFDKDRAGRRQQQPVDELEQRALARAAAAHERNDVTRFHREIHACQRGRPARVPETHIVESDYHDGCPDEVKPARAPGANGPGFSIPFRDTIA